MENTMFTEEEEEEDEETFHIAIPFQVRFGLFLVSLILSLACYCFVLYYFMFNKVLRRTLSNHTVIVLLLVNIVYELIGIPIFLNFFYHEGHLVPSSPTLCLVWLFIDEGLFSISLVLVAWASIERYILIFHGGWVATGKNQFVFHYCPLIVLVIYLILFYAFTILFPSCENTFEYDEPVCGFPLCYYDVKLVAMIDAIFHDILPILVTIFFNIVLLIRVIMKKRRLLRRNQWQKHRKMTLQLLSISILYFVFYIPDMVLELGELSGASEHFAAEFQLYLKFFSYYAIFLLPLTTAVSIPHVSTKVKNLILFKFHTTDNDRLVTSVQTYGTAKPKNIIAPMT